MYISPHLAIPLRTNRLTEMFAKFVTFVKVILI